ncbi:excisionase family protein [Atlantibacter hermannii]|uniref:excisionase family protein n=1 Tax=Atlantibacter hermannii TaxID=565 RepID=UPI0028A83B8A|nr:excisionase family protein [Atlantibacter hermannii]MDU1953191.1 excisionase family protein [Atlantibacter hermannii]
MSEISFITPNEWVTEQKLIELTGLRPGTIEAARRKSWLLGREYLHVSPDGVPKPTSECMYNRKAIDQWVESLKKRQPGARQ